MRLMLQPPHSGEAEEMPDLKSLAPIAKPRAKDHFPRPNCAN